MIFEHEIRIDRPAAEVFAFLADPGRLEQWVQGLESVEIQPGPSSGAGTRFLETLAIAGQKLQLAGHIRAAVDGESLAVDLENGDLGLSTAYSLRAEGASTLLHHEARIELRSFMLRLVAGKIEEKGRERLWADLERLKQRLETRG